ncbi:MAG TPA: thioredoxin fold domain-containing protein [Candidatus Saccharimonadales bacterium]|nr:thioredoxin fold domain-containing protein [Candidatus Saccharimonadales bacterium]
MRLASGRWPTFVAPLLAAGAALSVLCAPAAPVQAADPPKAEVLKWVSYNEAVKLAAASKKPILVDVFTTWCGWCKRMDATTYKDPRVVEDLNQDFVLVKLNAESDRAVTYKKEALTEERLAREVFGVTGFPTTVFVRHDQEVISPLPGYVPAAEFHTILRFIGTGAYEKMRYPEFKAKNP